MADRSAEMAAALALAKRRMGAGEWPPGPPPKATWLKQSATDIAILAQDVMGDLHVKGVDAEWAPVVLDKVLQMRILASRIANA